jgi:LuxR family maltose regulon positive regulatory protein
MIAFFPAQVDDARASPYQLAGMYEAFTPREYEILLLVCQGLSNMEIANRLVLSVGTVKFHMHNILGKLGVRDRPQAIAKAAQLGLK